jgi:NADH-ubiquinone oxidoreductase chain 4
MLFSLKLMIICYAISFILLLYKLNIFSFTLGIENYECMLETTQLNEKHKHSTHIILRNYSDIFKNDSNLKRLPLLMTTSFFFNKREIVKAETIKLNQIIEVMRLKKLSISIALIVFIVIAIEWNNLNVLTSSYQKGFFLTSSTSVYSGVILGYDHLSIPFILLLSYIFPIVFISNWTTVKIGEMKSYLSTILSSHYFLIIVFLVVDILMFYVSFEIILPFFFILLGMFGGIQKFRAMYYLFLYTLWGSLFMLIDFLTKIGENGTGIMGLLEDVQFSGSWSLIGAIAVIIAFSVKTPIVPFHLWLPLAHGDANVSGSIVLASIVLKMALYGFLRILIFILLLSFASTQMNMFFIFIFSLIFASTTTMRQNDLKVLVAYSSVAHMGSTLLGGFSNNHFGIFGSILFSIAHGVVSPALFIFVGAVFYDRFGTRIINYLKGYINLFPVAVSCLLIVVFGNMGTPLTANFIAEFLCILGVFEKNPFVGILAAISIILSACYSIYMYNRISTGTLSTSLNSAPDAYKREFSMLLPLMILMVLFGIYPSLISESIDLGLSHFLMGSLKNPFILLFILLSFLPFNEKNKVRISKVYKK